MLEEFKEKLLTDDIRDVYQRYLLGHNIWYFREKKGAANFAQEYDELKLYMSQKLELHVNNIAIVGSAKMGFSLSPSKKFRLFGEKSDIDIVIVSDKVFHASWLAYRELHQKGYLSNYTDVAKDIFRGFVSLKKVDTRASFFDSWSRKVDPLKKDFQTVFDIPHEVNYRIYDSWESVEDYHKAGLRILKNQVEKQKNTTNNIKESGK
jgi:hypothetical protein